MSLYLLRFLFLCHFEWSREIWTTD